MNAHSSAISFFFILAICLAGCVTQKDTVSWSTNPQTGSGYQMEKITILPSEVPGNFSTTESRIKNKVEMGDTALALGWETGYIVRYERDNSTDSIPTVLSQTIAVYPPENMPEIIRLIRSAEKSTQWYLIEDLPDPGLGDRSHASVAYVNARQDSVNITGSQDLFAAAQDALAVSPSQNGQGPAYYEIYFTKGSLLEVLRYNGPEADYDTLLNLSRLAYRKL